MENKLTCRTDYLFATPGFLTGAGSIFNIIGTYYEFNTSQTSEIADQKAISSDWCMAGRDLKEAFEEYQNSKKPQENLHTVE